MYVFLGALTFYNVRYAFMKVIGQCCRIFLLWFRLHFLSH